jgi:PAS domain S-box-containing protein
MEAFTKTPPLVAIKHINRNLFSLLTVLILVFVITLCYSYYLQYNLDRIIQPTTSGKGDSLTDLINLRTTIWILFSGLLLTVIVLLFYSRKINLQYNQGVQDSMPAENETFFRLLTENTNDFAIFMLDTNGFIQNWNSGATKIKGYQPEEIIGKSFKIFYTLEDQQKGEPLANLKMAKALGNFEKEGWRVKKDGSLFWANVVFTSLKDNKGVLTGYAKITRDVSEKKKIQADLEFLSLQISHSVDAIYSVDVAGRIETWNRGAENMYGFNREEALGKNANDLLQTIIIPQQALAEKEALENIGYWKGEKERIKKSGAPIYILASITTVRNNLNRITGYISVNVDITNEQKLRKELRHLASIVANSTEAIFSRNTDNQIISWNYGAELMFGISKEQAIGQSAFELGFVKLNEQEIAAVEVQINNAGSWTSEIIFFHRNGRSFYGSVTGSKILNEKQELEAYYFIVRDITIRKQLEEQLMQSNLLLEKKVIERSKAIYDSERRFRALIENSAEAFAMLDEFSNVLYRSPSSEKLLGDTSRLNTLNLAHPDDLKLAQAKMEEAMKNPAVPVVFQARFRHANDQYVWLEMILTNLFEVSEVRAMVANYRDITQRIAAEEALKKSEEHYRLLIEQSADGIFVCEPGGQYIEVNQAGCLMTGYSRREILQLSIKDIVLKEEFERIDDERALLSKHGITTSEWIFRRKDGSVFFGEIVSRELPSGKTQSVLRNITERKKSEQKIQKLNRELEQRVFNRTELLNKSIEELEAFSYSVSHDLRAPLRAINGFTTILEEEYQNTLDKEGRRITAVIKNNTLKMSQLIDGLLQFSRLGRQEILKTPIDNNVLIKEIIEATENNDGISWDVHSLHPVKADIHALRQVWVNLISNAAKYSSNNSIPKIEIGSFIKAGETVFYVKDNGVGFDEKYKNKLFKVFQRLHSTQEFEGTGIGLAIVEKIISKHDGKVWADAELGKGACFYFSIPAFS